MLGTALHPCSAPGPPPRQCLVGPAVIHLMYYHFKPAELTGTWTPADGSLVNAMGVTFSDGAKAVAAALAVDTAGMPSNCEAFLVCDDMPNGRSAPLHPLRRAWSVLNNSFFDGRPLLERPDQAVPRLGAGAEPGQALHPPEAIELR